MDVYLLSLCATIHFDGGIKATKAISVSTLRHAQHYPGRKKMLPHFLSDASLILKAVQWAGTSLGSQDTSLCPGRNVVSVHTLIVNIIDFTWTMPDPLKGIVSHSSSIAFRKKRCK